MAIEQCIALAISIIIIMIIIIIIIERVALFSTQDDRWSAEVHQQL